MRLDAHSESVNSLEHALREVEFSLRKRVLPAWSPVVFKPKINAESLLSDVVSGPSRARFFDARFSSQLSFASIKLNFVSENLPQSDKTSVQFFVKSLNDYMLVENAKRSRGDVCVKQSFTDPQVPSNEILPLVEVEGNRMKEYYFSGQNGETLKEKNMKDLRTLGQHFKDEFLKMFFPLGFPHSVSEGFLVYSKFRAVQHVASSILAVLSTQSLLIAAGLNPSPFQSTVVSWVLKDGCQHVGKFICSNFGTKMDAEPKKWRIMADLVYDFGAGLDVLSPFFSNNFLFIAGLANLAKGMALVSARATRLPIYSSFAKENNLSDLYAKGEAISVFSNGLGLLIGIHLTKTVCLSARNKLLLFPVLSFVHMFCVANEMRSAPLNTLNKERTKILIQDYLKTGKVSSPGEVRYKEKLFFLPEFLDSSSKNAAHTGTGTSISHFVQHSDFYSMAERFRNEKFMVLPGQGSSSSDLILHRSADGRDAIKAFLLSACVDEMKTQLRNPTCLDSGEVASRWNPSDAEVRSSCGNSETRFRGDNFSNKVSFAPAAKIHGDWLEGRGGESHRVKEKDHFPSKNVNSRHILDQACEKVDQIFPSFVQNLEKEGWLTHLFLESSGSRLEW